MIGPARRRAPSYQDYLEVERETGVRHEFLDGEVFAMAGGTPRHSRLKARLVGLFEAALGAGPCQTYDSDLKIQVLATEYATYADLAVICGKLERSPEDANAATNPSLLAEVLSPSTEAWDRGGKFLQVQQIPSLRHYLLLDPQRPQVEHYARQDDGSWRYTRHDAGGVVRLLGIEIAVDALYQNLPEPG